MLGRAVGMNLVATQAGDTAAIPGHLVSVAVDVPVAGVEVIIASPSEIDLEIKEKIVAGHKVIRVEKPARFRLAPAQMALPAN